MVKKIDGITVNNSRRITIYINENRYKAIRKLAEKNDRSISNMIDVIFKRYIHHEGVMEALHHEGVSQGGDGGQGDKT